MALSNERIGELRNVNQYNRCFGCDEQSQTIVTKCGTCDIHLCHGCKKYHKKLNADHTFIEYTVNQGHGSGDVPETMCSWHKSKAVKFWCTECGVFLCEDGSCKRDHLRHTLTSIKDSSRILQANWVKKLDMLLLAVNGLKVRRGAANDSLLGHGYVDASNELSKRGQRIIQAVQQELDKQLDILSSRKQVDLDVKGHYLNGIETLLSKAEKLNNKMAAAHHTDKLTDIDTLVNIIHEFNIVFPDIKIASEGEPISHLQLSELVVDSPGLEKDIEGILKHVRLKQLPQVDVKAAYMSMLLIQETLLKTTQKYSMAILPHFCNTHELIPSQTLSLLLRKGAKCCKDIGLIPITTDHQVSTKDFAVKSFIDDVANIVPLATNTIIVKGRSAIYLTDDGFNFINAVESKGMMNTFITYYDKTHFLRLDVADSSCRFSIVGIDHDKEDKFVEVSSYSLQYRLPLYHNNHLAAAPNGLVYVIDNFRRVLVIHLHIGAVQILDLEQQNNGINLDCISVDQYSNVLIGCSNGIIYLLGENNKLVLISKISQPVRGIMRVGEFVYVTGKPNYLGVLRLGKGKEEYK